LRLSGNRFVAFLSALLFGVHPLRVESVAWLSGRKDLLFTVFFLGALLGYLQHIKTGPKKYYWISLGLFLLSLLAKETAVVLPLVIILYMYLEKGKLSRSSVYKMLPFIGLSLLWGGIAIYSESWSGAIDHERASFAGAIGTAGYGMIFYLVKLFFPVRLSCYYEVKDLSAGFWIQAVVAVLILAGMWRYTSDKKKGLFGILFFLVTLAPLLQILPVGFAFVCDRYTYLPYLGMFYVISDSVNTAFHKRDFMSPEIRIPMLLLLGIALAAASFLSYRRCGIWKNDLALWNDALKNYPEAARAYQNRGLAYQREGRTDLAVADYTRALRIDPGRSQVHFVLGKAYLQQRDFRKAIDHFSASIKIEPAAEQALLFRGIAYNEAGDYPRAMTDFNRALCLDPRYAEAEYALGNTCFKMRRYPDSIAHFTSAIRLCPSDGRAFHNRGYVYFCRENYEEAIADLTQAIACDPDDSTAYYHRGMAYRKIKKHTEATRDIRQAAALGYRCEALISGEK
jgi:tetratricopeptide (TPR) repeat protein